MTGVSHPSAGAPGNLSYVIISPVKDESRYIEKTILSVLDQSVKPARWIIVDDGSTDGTPEIVERYAAVHPFIELLRTRQAGARDTGTAEAMASVAPQVTVISRASSMSRPYQYAVTWGTPRLRQALAAQPESRYSMTELTIADAFEDLPMEMRQRLAGGGKTGE